jgi:glycosyltransferase involved in cell wall biosynthesis
MAHLGIRERVHFPHSWKDFHLVRSHGRVYGVPSFLDPEYLLKYGDLFTHAAVVSAATLEELQAKLDNEHHSPHPQPAGSHQGYNLFRYRGSFYGVPQSTGLLDLGHQDEHRRPDVFRADTIEEVKERINAVRGTAPIEFAGWLPIYEFSGNCGRHPQFKHTAHPPEGYQFTCSAPPKKGESRWQKRARWWLGRAANALRTTGAMIRPFFALFRIGSGVAPLARVRVVAAMLRLVFRLLRNGARIGPILRLLQSRHLQSQILLSRCPGLVFLTSMPYTYGQNPWVIEIEDPTTLFYPLIQNGSTSDLRPRESPYYPIVKTLLESDECKAIITHMKSTALMVPKLFDSEKITRKVHLVPLGINLPQRWQRHEEADPEQIHLVFINSWCQVAANFYVRGGLDVLEAFAILHERYPQLRLTLRTEVPGLDDHYHRILEKGWVRVINRFMTNEEMSALLAQSHIFLLPAARVHILSLLQAMSYGLAVVASDGWGIEEYVTHERNGLIVKGRYGKTSWADEEAGILREDYQPLYTSDPNVVEGIVEAVSRLVEDHQLRRRLGRTARQDVQERWTLEGWNRGIKEVFDKIMPPSPATTATAEAQRQESVLTA